MENTSFLYSTSLETLLLLDNFTTKAPGLPPTVYDKITYVLQEYASYVITGLGFVLNLLCLVVLIHKNLRGSSSSFYMAFLAVIDIITLLCNLLWFHLMKIEVPLYEACKFFYFGTYWSSSVSIWLKVIMSCERLIVVWFVMKAKVWCTVKRAQIASVILCIVLAGVYLHHFWTVNYVNGIPYVCRTLPEYRTFYSKTFIHIRNSITLYIPIIVVIVTSTLIIIALKRAEQARSEMVSSHRSKNNQITRMLIAISTEFVVFNLPFALITAFWSHNSADPYWLSVQKFLLELSIELSALHHSSNFILYFCSSERFRSIIIQYLIFPFEKCRKRRNGFIPGTQESPTRTTEVADSHV